MKIGRANTFLISSRLSRIRAVDPRPGCGHMATSRELGSLVLCSLFLSNWIFSLVFDFDLIYIDSPFNQINLSESELIEVDMRLSSASQMDLLKSYFNWYYFALSSPS